MVELLKEALPQVTRVAVLSSPSSTLVQETERAARAFGLHAFVVAIIQRPAVDALAEQGKIA